MARPKAIKENRMKNPAKKTDFYSPCFISVSPCLRVHILCAIVVALFCCAGIAHAQSGSISFYAQSAATNQNTGEQSNFQELVSTFSLISPFLKGAGMEYSVDLRYSGYPSIEGRSSRFSIYNAYVGQRFTNGFKYRAGQMWLNELGALGSIGGGLVEYKHAHDTGFSWRVGGFGGLEPNILQAGYTSGVRKLGGYVSLDKDNGENHALGFVQMTNSGLTERSVLIFSNFLPVQQKFVVYQTAEYDLVGPAGMSSGNGLNYFFVNGRFTPTRVVELQGTFHHGHSIDTRTITQDQINGRPVDSATLTGLLFDSAEGRITVTAARGIRVFAGYGRDQTNQNDIPVGRFNYGGFISDLAGSGVDLHASVAHWTGTPHDALSLSIGKTIAQKTYISFDYASSVSVFRLTGSDGIIVENRPKTKLFGVSSVINLSRSFSLLVTVERTNGDTFSENRFLGGITYRFF